MPDNPDSQVFQAITSAPSPARPGEAVAMAIPAYSTEAKISAGEAVRLRQRMLLAEKNYEKKFKPLYDKSMRLWRGEHWPKDAAYVGEHRIVVNYMRHIIETKVASTCFNLAEIITKPQNPEGSDNEETAKKAVDYEYRHSNAQRELRRAFKDAQMVGFGVVMTGWEFQVENLPEMEGRSPVVGEMDEIDGSRFGSDPNRLSTISAAVESGMPLPAPVDRTKILKDGCFARRLDPRSFRISPEADWVIENAPYCGYVEMREVAEVKADPRYRNTRQLTGSTENLKGYLSGDYEKAKPEDLPADVRRVKLLHYFEKQRQLHVVFCDEHSKPLLTEKWYWEHGRYPFVGLFAAHTEDEFYPDPTPLMEWEHMQREINTTRSNLANVRAQMVPKWLVPKGAFTEQDKKRFKSGVIGTVIETTHPAIAQAAASLPLPQLPPDFFRDMQTAMDDLSAISTLDQYSLGGAPTKRLTTTEVHQISDQGGARRAQDRQDFEEACARVATDFLHLLQQYSAATRDLPIYDDQERVVGWEGFTRDQIQGEFDLEVYVGSTEIRSQQDRTKDYGFLLQSLLPFVQLGVIDAKPLIEGLLNSMPEIRNVEAIVNPPPPAVPPGMPGQPGMPPGGPGQPGPGMPPGAGPGMPPGAGASPPGMAEAGGGLTFPPALLAQLQNGNGNGGF